MAEKKRAGRSLDKANDSQELVSFVEELGSAVIYYQVSGNYVVLYQR